MPALILDADTTISGAIDTTLDNENAVETITGGISINIAGTGSISTLGNNADGIYAVADGLAITNDGLIDIAGDYSVGVFAWGDGNVIINNGDINVAGDGSSTILSWGDDSVTVNTGTLAGVNMTGALVDIWGQNASFDNSGTITGDGDGCLILQGGIGASFNNSGMITATGNITETVYFDGESFTNSGTLSGAKWGAEAANYDTGTLVFDNSGTIQGSITAVYLDHYFWPGPGTTTVTNSGTLSSNEYTLDIWTSHGGTVSVTNTATGLIEADSAIEGVVAAFIWSDEEEVTFVNDGAITAFGTYDSDNFIWQNWTSGIEIYSLSSVSLSNSGTVTVDLANLAPHLVNVHSIYLDALTIDNIGRAHS